MDYFPVIFSLLFVTFQGAPETGRRHLRIFLLQRSSYRFCFPLFFLSFLSFFPFYLFF
nr:preproendothelin [Mus musculus]